MKLYPHQRAALDGLYDAWRSGMENPLLVLPTGSGKSVLCAAFCTEAMQAFPTTRIVMATHVQELVEQNAKQLLRYWPQAPLGIYSAGLGRKDAHSPIVFGSIQSMVGKESQIQGADVIVIDEAHLLSPKDQSSYRKFISEMRRYRADTRILGLTATPWRLDSGHLLDSEDALFDGIAHEVTIDELLDAGLLCPLVTYGTKTRLEVGHVKVQGGEYVTSALQAAIDKDDITAKIVRESLQLGEHRGHWLAFCAGIEHARNMRDMMRAAGVSCETISSKTPKAERKKIIDDFRAGRVRCLTNANVLVTGFDAPLVDFIIMARPTKSSVLYLQMLGRGLRTADGKESCLVADFASNIFEHGPINQVRPPVKGPKKATLGVPPVKECPKCHIIIPVQRLTCDCGHEWPRDYLAKLNAEAAQAAFVSNSEPPQWYTVTNVHYQSVRNKDNTHNMLRVEYHCGFSLKLSELVLIEHESEQARVAKWWSERSTTNIIPGTVQMALHICGDLKWPTKVLAQRVGKYLNVIDHSFS